MCLIMLFLIILFFFIFNKFIQPIFNVEPSKMHIFGNIWVILKKIWSTKKNFRFAIYILIIGVIIRSYLYGGLTEPMTNLNID